MADNNNDETSQLAEKTATTSLEQDVEKEEVKDEKETTEVEMKKQAIPATPAPAITINSPPSQSPSASTSASTSSSRSSSPLPKQEQNLPLQTPAPASNSFAKTPSAPAPKSIPKDLPLQTPISSSTPQSANQASNKDKIDLSEFDPFATPAKRDPVEIQNPPPAAGPSTPGRQGRGEGEGEGQVEKEEQEPTFNFSGFLKDLRMKSAEPIAKYLKSYVSFRFVSFMLGEQKGEADI